MGTAPAIGKAHSSGSAHGSAAGARRGFTLLELMIVISIIALLAGMLMPMYTVVQRSMRRSSTETVLKKVDTALRMFKADWGVYPCQRTYPDPFTGAGFPNRLYYQIGTDISWDPDQADGTSPAKRVQLDMAAAEAKYDDAHPTAGLTFKAGDMANTGKRYPARVNRMARQQVRLGVLSGNLDLRGQVLTDETTGVTVSDRRAIPILAAAERRSDTGPGPGWAADYLAGDLEARFRSGDAILDAWRNPLVYIHQSVPGVKATHNPGFDFLIMHRRYGLGPLGFDPTAGPAPGIVASGRAVLLYYGRIRLSASNAGDGKPTPTDPTWFPDAEDLRHADMRWYCPPGQETEFELWSAGPGRRFSYMRDDPDNSDNIAVVKYEKELPP